MTTGFGFLIGVVLVAGGVFGFMWFATKFMLKNARQKVARRNHKQ